MQANQANQVNQVNQANQANPPISWGCALWPLHPVNLLAPKISAIN